MATIDSLTLKATPLGSDTIELNDGQKATLGSLPVSTPQAAADAAVLAAAVQLTGAQTVAGVKTFTSSPVVPGVQLSTTSIPASAIAQIRWNDTDKCAEFETEGGVMVQIGQETLIYARNASGVNEPNGAAVVLTGASGQRATVSLARADTLNACRSTIGLVTTAAGIADNGFGFVTTLGLVRDLDTSGFAEGVELWLSPTVAGTYTTTKPSTVGQFVVRIGFVVRSHATQGSILVAPHFHGSVTGDAVMNAVTQEAARTAISAAAADLSNTAAQTVLELKKDRISTPMSFEVIGSSGNGLPVFGDSNTYGTNAAKPGGVIPAAEHWQTLVSAQLGWFQSSSYPLNSNYGQPGSRISWVSTNDKSHFNQLGRLTQGWTGPCVIMPGWNNLSSANMTATFFTWLRRAHEACIARTLIDDWAGVGYQGYSRTGSAGANSWATTSSTNDTYSPSDDVVPFSTTAAVGDRLVTVLSANQTASFSLSGKRAIALFFETAPSGGAFTISVNGVQVGSFDSTFTDANFTTDRYPFVIWLEGVPATAAISIAATAAAGSRYFLGYGWVDVDTSAFRKRTIIYSTTIGNTANGRTVDTLNQAAFAAQAAASVFGSDYPEVKFANVAQTCIGSTCFEATDVSHLTSGTGGPGSRRVAESILNSVTVCGGRSPNYLRVKTAVESALAITDSSGNLVLAPGSAAGVRFPTSASGLSQPLAYYTDTSSTNIARFYRATIDGVGNSFKIRADLGDLVFDCPTSQGFRFQIQTVTLGTYNATAFTPGVPVALPAYTVATLPSGSEGMLAYVTDASAPTYGSTLVGGGSVRCKAFRTNSAWVAG